MKNIRTAIIGAGYRGRYLITLLQKINLFDIIAVSDISPNLSEIISQLFAGEKIPKIYNSGTDDYRRMLNENTIDLVIIASPWHLHKEQTIEALKSGCHVAIEVKGALDIDEYPDIIHESRQNKKQVFPLENTLFRNDILAINNMIHAGIFGRLVFLQGGYRHDLTHILIDQTGNFGVQNGSESEWRSKYYETENGDLYPTHGLAPLCMFLDINHTDHIKSITSFSTKPGLGLHAWNEIYRHTTTHIPNGRCRHFNTPNRFRGSNKLIARYHSPTSPLSQLRSSRNQRNLECREKCHLHRWIKSFRGMGTRR